jgi:hypothetical protein
MRITGEDKVIHHRLRVHLNKDRIGFELQLPRDAHTVTGLATGVRAGSRSMAAAGGLTTHAGMLTLRWNLPGDIFYQGPVPLEHRHEDNYSPMGLGAPDGFLNGTNGFAVEGRRIEAVEIAVPGELRTLKGYYVDVINRLAGLNEPYEVDIFLIYRRTRA